MSTPFREETINGRLMIAEPDVRTRLKYTIWFDYTRKMLNAIQEGDFVAVPNFSLEERGIKYSILKLTNVLPFHFALGSSQSDLRGYPGFISESAKNIVVSWREQETESLEDMTKIVCIAIPTGMEFEDVDNIDDIILIEESAMPMIGEECKLLSEEMTKRIINGGIDPEREEIIIPGHLIRNENIKVYLRTEDLIKTHFGVFGFTGVGKSNMFSSLISLLLSDNSLPIKIVLFDLMDEYTGLLIDKILDDNISTNIIYLGEQILPRPTLDYIYERNDKATEAARIFLKGLLLPKGLKTESDRFTPFIEYLLQRNKIKIFEKRGQSVKQFIEEIWEDLDLNRLGGVKKTRFMQMRNKIFEPYFDKEITSTLAREFIENLGGGGFIKDNIVREIREDTRLKEKLDVILIPALRRIASVQEEMEIPKKARISIYEIIEGLNNGDTDNLYIITSHDPNELRRFSRRLGFFLSENRRRTGRISPLVCMLFDEADQFIPYDATGTQKDSKAIIEDLTRRGRKFGIGIGIATQRAVYLDTNIMGQLHTYFISKLPREIDRQRVGEAFSLAEEEFTQTFKFRKGDWLLVSHDAMGVDAVPIPIHAPNAEDRIRKIFKSANNITET